MALLPEIHFLFSHLIWTLSYEYFTAKPPSKQIYAGSIKIEVKQAYSIQQAVKPGLPLYDDSDSEATRKGLSLDVRYCYIAKYSI